MKIRLLNRNIKKRYKIQNKRQKFIISIVKNIIVIVFFNLQFYQYEKLDNHFKSIYKIYIYNSIFLKTNILWFVDQINIFVKGEHVSNSVIKAVLFWKWLFVISKYFKLSFFNKLTISLFSDNWLFDKRRNFKWCNFGNIFNEVMQLPDRSRLIQNCKLYKQ